LPDRQRRLAHISAGTMGRYQSGQMGRAVNPLRKRFVGSNPSLPIWAGIAQLVEHRPSKPLVAGSSPVSRSFCFGNGAHVAQLVEHVLGKDGVTSSNLVVGF
jgi:hypothetical protein